MECHKCNKKHQYHCRHLIFPYQNICGYKMARFSDDFEPLKDRLDAPCEQCLTYGCIYNPIH